MQVAVNNQRWDIIKWFVQQAKVDVKVEWFYERMTLLHGAAGNNQFEMVKWLVEGKHVDINGLDEDGFTAFHYALFLEYLEIARWLADVPGVNVKLAEFLVEKTGINMMAVHLPALQYAVMSGNIEMVKFVHDKGVDISTSQALEQAAAKYAIEYRRPEVFKWLIEDMGLDMKMPNIAEIEDDRRIWHMKLKIFLRNGGGGLVSGRNPLRCENWTCQEKLDSFGYRAASASEKCMSLSGWEEWIVF